MEKNKSFTSLRDLPLEVRLTAWLDGQTSDEESAEIEHLIATNVEASAMLDKLAAGAEFGNKVFDDMLTDPVPLHLVRAIKEAGKAAENRGKPGLRPANSNGIFSFMPQLVAASAILLLAGGYSGYFIGLNKSGPMPSELSETSVFAPVEEGADAAKTRGFQMPGNPTPETDAIPLDAVMVGYHNVYSAQSARLSEMPVSDPAAIKTWLGDATDIEFSIPDLSAGGFSFAGARLLAAGSKPMGALFYRNDAGETLMIGFWKQAEPRAEHEVKTVGFSKADVNLYYRGMIGGKGQVAVAYVVPANNPKSQLLAEKIISAF